MKKTYAKPLLLVVDVQIMTGFLGLPSCTNVWFVLWQIAGSRLGIAEYIQHNNFLFQPAGSTIHANKYENSVDDWIR
jgi:hypothetical protein